MSKYIDLHVVQTVPPSCVNRDDTGSPKTAIYGGVTRSRVSSQAWKHAIRMSFGEYLPEEMIGSRTKRIVPMVMEQVVTIAQQKGILVDNPEKVARKVLTAARLKLKDDINVGTDALFFMSVGQAKALAELALENPEKEVGKEAAKAALRNHPSVDMALFGRMVADDPSLNYDASVQVAHAISTHGVHIEYDYFTALDDRADEDKANASHIATTEFASSTLYRYATINLTELRKHVGPDLATAVYAFIKAFIRSMPTGKQNSFANRTIPDMVYVTVREDQPINFSGAFEKAIRADTEGYVEKSKRRLAEYAARIYEEYASSPTAAFVVGADIEGAKRVRENELLECIKAISEEYAMTGGGI